MVKVIEFPPLNETNQSPYSHAGGCQMIGDCLVVPFENDRGSLILFFEVSDPLAPVELRALRTVRSNRQAGSAGVTNAFIVRRASRSSRRAAVDLSCVRQTVAAPSRRADAHPYPGSRVMTIRRLLSWRVAGRVGPAGRAPVVSGRSSAMTCSEARGFNVLTTERRVPLDRFTLIGE